MDTTAFYRHQAELDEWQCTDLIAMDSQFYETPSAGLNERKNPNRVNNNKCNSPIVGIGELASNDLNSPELTFDHLSIQHFIASEIQNSAQANPSNPLDDSVSIFTELLNEAKTQLQRPENGQNHTEANRANLAHQQSSNRNELDNRGNNQQQQVNNYTGQHYPMPQQSNLGTDRYGAESNSVVKREPSEAEADYTSGGFSGFRSERSRSERSDDSEKSLSPLSQFGGSHSRLSGKGGKHGMKNVDKASDEYKKRRERNNIAVRKSREKAKIRSRETEKKVSELARENDGLRKRVEMLSKELCVLKSLLTNVGVPPESVDKEIAMQLEHSSAPYGSSI